MSEITLQHHRTMWHFVPGLALSAVVTGVALWGGSIPAVAGAGFSALTLAILLGMVESGQWQRRFENRTDKSQSWPEWTADIARKRGIPMARLGKPQEPAQALLFLASPLAR